MAGPFWLSWNFFTLKSVVRSAFCLVLTSTFATRVSLVRNSARTRAGLKQPAASSHLVYPVFLQKNKSDNADLFFCKWRDRRGCLEKPYRSNLSRLLLSQPPFRLSLPGLVHSVHSVRPVFRSNYD